MKRECETCIKRKTMYCPNSSECFNTENKPHYQNKIMLLEENQELNRKLNEAVHKATEFESEVYELKKQLEEKENIACNWKDSCLENAGKIEKLENQLEKSNTTLDTHNELINYMKNQQKEFIKYMENKINEPVGYNLLYDGKQQAYKETLSKYKEIIGGKE